MGQQQLLLIILGVIVVGIAVAVGITMFQDNAVSANRDAVINDLVNLASRAQQFYRRPYGLGGGQGTFNTGGPNNTGITSITQLTSKPLNANGSYVLGTVSATQVNLDGYGMENGDDGAPIHVIMQVFSDSTYCDPQN